MTVINTYPADLAPAMATPISNRPADVVPTILTTGMRILIIDDEESIRSTLSMMLQGLGNDVVEAGTAQTALKEVDKAQFDLAFLDLRHGDDDGLEVLPELLRGNANLDVVVFTAHASIESAVEAM